MQRQLLEAVIHHCPNPAQRVIIWHTILKIDIAVHHTLLFVFSTHAACITELPVKMWYQPWCNLNFSAACKAAEVPVALKDSVHCPEPMIGSICIDERWFRSLP